MAIRVSSPHPSANDGGVTVKVKKPFSNSAREIRDAILRDYFGYTESDIKELDAQMPGKFIVTELGGSNKEATPEQVKNSPVDPIDGLIPIPLPAFWTKTLPAFRERRASFEAFKVGMFISDVAVRKLIADDLADILLLSSGEKRIEALNKLIVTIEGSGESHYQVFQALRFLTNESGYKDNPFLLIAFARAQIHAEKTPSMVSKGYYQSLISNALKAANVSLYGTSNSDVNKINRQEAAMINYWASELYGKSNAGEDAINRRWIERFLLMPDEERESYEPGEVIEMLPPGAVVIERPSGTQEELREANRKRAEQVGIENDINQMGSEWVPSDHKSSDRFQTPSDKLEMNNALVPNKNRQSKKGYVPKFRTVNFSRPVFNQANIQSDYIGSIFTVVTEIYKYAATDRRMNDIAVYHNQRRALEKQIDKEKMRVVPPRPETVRQAIIYVRKYGRMTVDRFTKQNIPPTLRELEVMLEESYAFYKLQ